MSKEKLEFLLRFFQDETYAGWYNIATTLIEQGACIVAGRECIWKGGIGNFIDVSPALNAIDCSFYEFRLDDFLSSEWFKENKQSELNTLKQKLTKVQTQIEEIEKL